MIYDVEVADLKRRMAVLELSDVGQYGVYVIDDDLWILSNATWDGTNFNRVDTTKTAFGLNLRGKNNFPGEAEQGAALWVCQPGSNPISSTYGAVGGWELGWDVTAFRDLVIGGYGIEIDGHGTLPYGRVAHITHLSAEWTGILTNWFVDLSAKDVVADPGWFIGRLDDAFHVRRTAGSSTTWVDHLIVYNSGAVVLPNLPEYADNAAAVAGGLVEGAVYQTATGELRIRV